MAKVLRCRDVGMECDFVTQAETAEERLQQAACHAQLAHGMQEGAPEILAGVRATIRNTCYACATRAEKMSGATAGQHMAMMALEDVAYARQSPWRKTMRYR